MRILHFNSYYQTGPFYKNLYDRQIALGDEISVYVPAPRGFDPGGRDYGAYARLDINHGRLDRFFAPIKEFKTLRGALRLYAREKFDASHAHSLVTNGGLALKFKERFGIPYAVAVRDADVNVILTRMPWLRPSARKILAEASRVVFLSAPYRDSALKPYLSAAELAAVREKSVIIPNGVDQMWLENPPEPREAPNPDEIKLLFVGQLIARKNLPAAIRAAEALTKRGRKVKLTVVGQPLDKAVVDAARACPLVELLPPRPMAELKPLYRAADVFLLPSGRETFGLVYAEAISQGLPVLYSRGQGFDGQFPDGTVGFPIDPSDPESIADKVEAILSDYARFSRAALEGSAKFDWDKITKTYQKLYEEVVR